MGAVLNLLTAAALLVMAYAARGVWWGPIPGIVGAIAWGFIGVRRLLDARDERGRP